MAAVPEGLEHESPRRFARAIEPREALLHTLDGGGFVTAAVLLAVLGHTDLAWRWDVGIALVLAFAVAGAARFDIGTGYAVPTQVVFVPALLVSPPQYAPLIALAGWLLSSVPDLARGASHPSRLLLVPGNCWFAVGPAAVLTMADAGAPDWGDWPVWLLALVAQFAGDVLANAVRDRLIFHVPPALELRVLGYVWAIDLALSPLGLLAAFASLEGRFAFLAVLPLVGLLVVFSAERTRRFEAELANTRAREALIAGASHELQTPLAVMSGVIDTLANSPHLPDDRRAQSHAMLQRQLAHLRHLVGQFVDYARLKAGQELLVSVRPADAGEVLRSVAALWQAGGASVSVDEAGPVRVLADPARVRGVAMALVANALKFGPPEGPVELACRAEGRRAVITVADRGPGIPEGRLDQVFDDLEPGEEGSGIGLYLARTGLRAQGGDVRLAGREGGGLVATIYLPLAP